MSGNSFIEKSFELQFIIYSTFALVSILVKLFGPSNVNLPQLFPGNGDMLISLRIAGKDYFDLDK